MKVKEVMTHNPITLSTKSTLKDGAGVFIHSHIDSTPVVDEEFHLVGMFSKIHLFKAIEEGKSPDTSINILMNTQVSCVQEEENAKIVFDKKEDKFPVITPEGKLIGILTKTDLLKAYNRKLEYTVKNLNTILGSSDRGVIAIDNQLKVTFFNERARKLLGDTEDSLVGKSIYEIMSDSTLPKVIETGKEEIRKTISYQGKKIITNRTPVFYEHRIIGAVALFEDATERNEFFEEYKAQKSTIETLQTILEMTYDGIVVVDKKGYITMMSKAYAKFLGVDHREVIGKHVTEVVENTELEKILETGQTDVADLQRIKGNNMIASRIPIIKDGKIQGAIGKILFRRIEDLDVLYKRINKMKEELEHHKKDANSAYYSFESIIGQSKEMIKTKKLAEKAAYTHSNVLLLGESGTGKELFAHAIHKKSNRSKLPFVKVNCAAIPNDLLESELFGYEGGAFTGAQKKGKIGKFEVADGGTIFLDEIGDMSLHMQAKLLRILQEKEIEKIGAISTKKVDVRIIAATNQNLADLVKKGKFRGDLFYRLNVVTVNIPPLRKRQGDIEILARHLIDKICNSMGRYVEGISEKAVVFLNSYQWPGNIRELENVIERAINIIGQEIIIQPKHLPEEITGNFSTKEIKSLKERVEEIEKQTIIEAIEAVMGNKAKAARLLNISRASLYEKIEKYHL